MWNYFPIQTPKSDPREVQHLSRLSAEMRATLWVRRFLLPPDVILKSKVKDCRRNQSNICFARNPFLIFCGPPVTREERKHHASLGENLSHYKWTFSISLLHRTAATDSPIRGFPVNFEGELLSHILLRPGVLILRVEVTGPGAGVPLLDPVYDEAAVMLDVALNWGLRRGRVLI